ncbi:Aegerolysin [Viridothelium virens]|uniref:Aegerolysin n=1 Tax=Viridothelium virens TaxID=1048519 RepID=A0A6A6HPE1_VIRVR|nr:Aegerolysin [Viridothelium virens]
MGHSQWVSIVIRNFTHKTKLEIKNCNRIWGKFHQAGNPDSAEIRPEDINGRVIEPNGRITISSSGRSYSAGCEGNFEIHTVGNEKSIAEKVCKVTYDCPYWWYKSNKFEVTDKNKKFRLPQITFSKEGALGEKTIEVEEY